MSFSVRFSEELCHSSWWYGWGSQQNVITCPWTDPMGCSELWSLNINFPCRHPSGDSLHSVRALTYDDLDPEHWILRTWIRIPGSVTVLNGPNFTCHPIETVVVLDGSSRPKALSIHRDGETSNSSSRRGCTIVQRHATNTDTIESSFQKALGLGIGFDRRIAT